MFRKLLLATVLVALVPTLGLADPIQPITALYVFGDSLSDGGNAYLRTGGLFPPPPYAQRMSNGPVAVEYLAARLGVPLNPSVSGGTNYAVAGAATGQVPVPATPGTTDNALTISQPALAPFLANTGIEVQAAAFAASPPAFDPATSLFVLWGGANDFFINPSAVTATSAVGNIFGELMQLYGLGARNFLVPNLPDLSLTPTGLSLSPAEQLGLHQLTLGFNAGLKSTLDLMSLLPGIDIVQFDTFGLLNSIVANPGAFGFTNVTSACIATPGCDASMYLFWDGVHPTTAAAAILGDQFDEVVNPVPEPATLSLLAMGLAGIRIARRRQRPRR